MAVDWPSVVSLGLWGVTALGIFLARNWLTARIAKGVQHRLDSQLEEMRADLRRSEERLKSELRDRESEISTLRNNVLTGSASRQTMLDKRRFEAVERIWTAVNELAKYKTLSEMMAVINVKRLIEQTTGNDRKQFFSVFEAFSPNLKEYKNVARDEQPFVPDLLWAYFTAYSVILMGTAMRFEVLKIGVEDPEKLLKEGHTQKLLKAALPHRIDYIDQNPDVSYHYFLEELETLLLAQIRVVLEGTAADQQSALKAKQIMAAVNEVRKEDAQISASAVN